MMAFMPATTEQVRIGAITYTVEDVPNLQDGGDPIDGQFVHSTSTIKLEATLAPSARQATLWHEIVHGILIHAGYAEHDEGQISAIGYGLMQVLHDNPWLASEAG